MRLVEIVETLTTVGTLFSVILSPRGCWRTPECQEVAQMEKSIIMEMLEGLFTSFWVSQQVTAGTEMSRG